MNSKYRIGFLCAGAAFFLFITLAYKMTYDYTMDKYMEKQKRGFILRNFTDLSSFILKIKKRFMNLPKYLCQIFRKKCARKLHRESKLQLQKNYMLF